MSIKTTVIGAYPKPDYLPVTDWFRNDEGPDNRAPTAQYEAEVAAMGDVGESLFQRAAGDVIADQIAAGIDIVTDGEVRRENYVHYHCRHLHGMDFATLTERPVRTGTYRAELPTVTAPISAGAPFLVHDWQVAQKQSSRPVKVTLPGPMTISDTTADNFYHDAKRLGADLAIALNQEILALVDAGCLHIQVDEPLFARKAEAALSYGIENMERCFHGLPATVTRTVHICCGYPDRLDNPDYPKAPLGSYFELADALEDAAIDAVSLEDAHRPNDLALLDRFTTKSVVLGVLAVAKSAVEEVDAIEQRLRLALEHIEAERLIAAPDCGLGLLNRKTANKKLQNMCLAASRLA
jgi:5-methyltetrahydropteroyltriglutamate--homocysteine methyltransferase